MFFDRKYYHSYVRAVLFSLALDFSHHVCSVQTANSTQHTPSQCQIVESTTQAVVTYIPYRRYNRA